MMFKKPWILCNQLLQAIETRNCEMAEKILNGGFDVDSLLIDGKSAISVCMEKSSIEIANLLIEKGCSLSLKSHKGESPLHLAVKKSDYAAVELLLKNRADVTSINPLGQTALHMACERNSLDIAALLINKSTNSAINIPDRDGATPLMYACKLGSVSMVKYLLDKGCEVNVIDVRGDSPLLVAVLNNQCSAEMLGLILDAGADVQQKNRVLDTALLRALYLMCVNLSNQRDRLYDLCVLLIDAGSDLNCTNLSGQTPLHIALTIKDVDLVKKLLNSGCDMNLPDCIGLLPLHYACRSNVKNSVNLLIDSGANLHIVNWSDFKNVLHDKGSISLLNYLSEKSKTCPLLTHLCRTVIRKSLRKCISKSMNALHVPPLLKKFILLECSTTALNGFCHVRPF